MTQLEQIGELAAVRESRASLPSTIQDLLVTCDPSRGARTMTTREVGSYQMRIADDVSDSTR